MLDSVSHPKLRALRSLHTSNLKLDEEFDAFEFAQNAGSGRLSYGNCGSIPEGGMNALI
jgi:hypothetical protein